MVVWVEVADYAICDWDNGDAGKGADGVLVYDPGS